MAGYPRFPSPFCCARTRTPRHAGVFCLPERGLYSMNFPFVLIQHLLVVPTRAALPRLQKGSGSEFPTPLCTSLFKRDQRSTPELRNAGIRPAEPVSCATRASSCQPFLPPRRFFCGGISSLPNVIFIEIRLWPLPARGLVLTPERSLCCVGPDTAL